MLGRHHDLDDVGVLLAHLLVDQFELVRHSLEVVIADDAFDFAEARNLVDDVHFEIDVIEAGDDRLADEHEPLLFGAGPAAAVGLPAKGRDHRAGRLSSKRLKSGGLARKSSRSSISLAPCLAAS